VEGEVSDFAELHHDDQDTFVDESSVISHDVGVSQVFEKIGL
jgi:hypothetical protein